MDRQTVAEPDVVGPVPPGLVNHDRADDAGQSCGMRTTSYDEMHCIALPSPQPPDVQGSPRPQSGAGTRIEDDRPAPGFEGERSTMERDDEWAEASPATVEHVAVDGFRIYSQRGELRP